MSQNSIYCEIYFTNHSRLTTNHDLNVPHQNQEFNILVLFRSKDRFCYKNFVLALNLESKNNKALFWHTKHY